MDGIDEAIKLSKRCMHPFGESEYKHSTDTCRPSQVVVSSQDNNLLAG